MRKQASKGKKAELPFGSKKRKVEEISGGDNQKADMVDNELYLQKFAPSRLVPLSWLTFRVTSLSTRRRSTSS